MSQAGVLVPGGTPHIATQYVEDDGSIAIPAGNILNVLSNETSQNNDHGIQTRGSGNTVTIYLTNRITGTVTTANATPTTAVTLALGATPAVFVIEGNTTAFDATDVAGGSYTFAGAARTDGASATLFGSEFINQFEEAAMGPSNVVLTSSGNSILVQVVGIAATTIRWSTILTYRMVT